MLFRSLRETAERGDGDERAQGVQIPDHGGSKRRRPAASHGNRQTAAIKRRAFRADDPGRLRARSAMGLKVDGEIGELASASLLAYEGRLPDVTPLSCRGGVS
jgi:hypothetical protein